MDIVLYEPEIPPNTGNIMRLCANLGAALHLIEPLGFELDDRRLRRAGLDYRDLAGVQVHADWASCRTALSGRPTYGLSTHGTLSYSAVTYAADAVLVFGPETRGLPTPIRQEFEGGHLLRIPMRPDSRSLNLSNAVAVVAYEVQRQLSFPGLV
jgi:tRNA (cytidine/uridine-2'-O-)-methyltransferase